MNPALFSFYPKFLLSEKTGSDLTPKLQVFDETPYEDNGIDLDAVAGIIYSAKRENVSFYANTDYDDPDVTLDPVSNVKVDLPVDATDNALYGDYEFTYKVKVTNEIIGVDGATPAPGAATFNQLLYEGTVIPDFITKVNQLATYLGSNFVIQFLNSSGTVLGQSVVTGAEAVDADIVVNFTEVTDYDYASIAKMRFLTYYSETVDVGYCAQDWPTANLVVTSDCIRAQIQVQDQTTYQASDTLTRLITLNYPVLSNGTPVASPETTSTASMLVGPNIWTGSYAIFLSSTLVRTQTDTLVLSYILEAYNPYLVTCDAGLCCMKDCIGNIFTAYQNALTQGSPNLNVLTNNVITIMGYVSLYSMNVTCGATEAAGAYLSGLQTYMDSIGCDCNCSGNTASSGPTIVYPLFADPQPNYVPISYLESDNITIDSNTKVPSNKAVINYVFSNFYSKTFIDDNFYNETETDALLTTNFYTKIESDERYVRLFNTSYSAVGVTPLTLNQKSGRVDIGPSGPVAPGDNTTYQIDNTFCVADGLVLVQIHTQYGYDCIMDIVEVKSYDGYFTVLCRNTGTVNLDDPIRIQFIIV